MRYSKHILRVYIANHVMQSEIGHTTHHSKQFLYSMYKLRPTLRNLKKTFNIFFFISSKTFRLVQND